MAIRMMVTKEEYLKNPENIEVVTDYPGHAINEVYHSYGHYIEVDGKHKLVDTCPYYEKRTYESERTLFPECPKECRHKDPLYMRTSHQGLVLETREVNGRDDSDFYAIVWNPETQSTDRIEYATTRGWSYPNNAEVDATPEVRKEYEAWFIRVNEEQRQREETRRAKAEAIVPRVGRTVEVIKGRKLPKGTIARVFWLGLNQFKAPKYGKNPALYLDREVEYFDIYASYFNVGLELNNGSKVFVSAENVQVIQVEE